MIESSNNSIDNSFKRNSIIFLTLLFAFCSILYELLLAQSLSSIMGNTILRYNMTIGIYVASMGFGAICYTKLPKLNESKTLISVELLLASFGFFAPFWVLMFDGVMFDISKNLNISYYSNLIQSSIFTFNHTLILIIGFLSGFELPLLMDLFKKYSEKSSLPVLGVDYLGTLLGAIVFPLYILPFFSIFHIGGIVAVLNLLGALYFSFFVSEESNKKLRIIVIILILILLMEVFKITNLENLVLNKYYYR